MVRRAATKTKVRARRKTIDPTLLIIESRLNRLRIETPCSRIRVGAVTVRLSALERPSDNRCIFIRRESYRGPSKRRRAERVRKGREEVYKDLLRKCGLDSGRNEFLAGQILQLTAGYFGEFAKTADERGRNLFFL